ncbi:MAG: transporter [Anaerolineaceae bacterium]|nr:transporter [Anaerolineaceae bacterium]
MLTMAPKKIRIFQPTKTRLDLIVDQYEGIDLKEMDSVALLNRVDTKFMLSENQLLSILNKLKSAYRVLDVKGVRLNRYRTLYFDTPDFDLYHQHVTRGCNCYKVRSREYVDSHLFFMEVKYKNQKKRTIKNRIHTHHLLDDLGCNSIGLLQAFYPFDSRELEPKLWNTFTRITLVSKRYQERLTIDLDLQFFNENRQMGLPGIVVAEVKQDGLSEKSDFIQLMRGTGNRSTGFSKYCMGVSMLYDGVKKNTLKPKQLMVKKLQMGVNYG